MKKVKGKKAPKTKPVKAKKMKAKREETEVGFLRKVRKLLAKPGAWIQGSEAKDKKGADVFPQTKGAVKFCLIGAVHRVDGPKEKEGTAIIEEAIAELYPQHAETSHMWPGGTEIIEVDIPSFNDAEQTKKKDVLKVLDKAIEFAKNPVM